MITIADLLNKRAKVSVVGLGYVGLPLALALARKVPVIGYDKSTERVELLKHGIDPSRELSSEHFQNTDILFTSNPENLRLANIHIVAVPTPVNKNNLPDLGLLLNASEIVGKNLKPDDVVVFESTVYPGATEEDCIPVLERFSGLKYPRDFKVGYSPERINPGDKFNTLESTIKVVAACDASTLELLADLYSLVVRAGIYKASSIKVAEAAKIIENTQRDVNIALMNEISILFNRMGINTYEVLEAASTKWNFLKFQPGLVGGHCIGVDPYYLAYKAVQYRYHPQVIKAGRFVNDSMGFYVAKQLVKKLIQAGKNILQTKVLVMGVTFKENVSDIRNSRVVDVVTELQSYGVSVDIYDPMVSAEELMKEYGLVLINKPQNDYDGVVVAVMHEQFKNLDENYFLSIVKADGKGILFDVKGIYRGKINQLTYWSL